MSSPIDLGFDLDALLNKSNGRSNRTKKEYIKEGASFYRLLPSYDPNNRRIDFEYSTHWLSSENGNKMVVQCTRDTEGYCPLCEAKLQTDALVKRLEGEYPELKSRPKEASERLSQLNEQAKALGRSKTTYFNAINAAGEVVILELNATVSKALTGKMAEAVQVFGIDPTNVKGGVWFSFNKTGKGRDSVVVDFKRININVNGKITQEFDQTPLTDDLIARLPTAVADLKNPDNMYIQVFSSKDLADFLRGIPLKNKYQKRTQPSDSAPAAVGAVNEQAPASTETASGPYLAPVATPAPVATSTPVGAGSTSADIEAEIARLRSLAGRTSGGAQ